MTELNNKIVINGIVSISLSLMLIIILHLKQQIKLTLSTWKLNTNGPN